MRFTIARVDRWDKDLDRIEGLLLKLREEMQGARVVAKGGRITHVTNALIPTRAALGQVALARENIAYLRKHEEARKQ
jgi:hypothetical protein